MSKRNRVTKIEEPGEPGEPGEQLEQVTETSGEPAADTTADAQGPAPVVAAVDDSDPATLLADFEPGALPVEIPQPLIETNTGHLPDASEIDPATIKTMTLTKQGWVLPSAAIAHAAG